jgi:DNA-binding GntR family transcriptional regulator
MTFSMTMTNTPPNSVLSTRIADELRQAILSGELSPGERIRQEELAEQFGASRIPVREALRILVTDGLVNMVSNSGAWVSSLTQAECSEHYQIRERLEPLLLRYNLPELTAADIARAAELVELMKQAPDLETFMRLDREFHWITYSRVETNSLTELIERLWNTTQPYRRVFMKLVRSGGIEVTHLEHELLLEAIKRRDSEEAESILHGHIRRTRIELDRHPEVFAHEFEKSD